MRHKIAQNGRTQGISIGLECPHLLGRERGDEPAVGAEISGPVRQLTGEQPAGLGGKSGPLPDAALQRVSESPLQCHHGERLPETRRTRRSANLQSVGTLQNGSPQAVGFGRRLMRAAVSPSSP